MHNLYSDAKHPEVDGPVVQQAVRTQPGPSVFGPLQLLGLVVIFAGQYGELSALRTNLAGEKRQEREWLKLEGWINKGRRGRDGAGKGRGSVIHRA